MTTTCAYSFSCAIERYCWLLCNGVDSIESTPTYTVALHIYCSIGFYTAVVCFPTPDDGCRSFPLSSWSSSMSLYVLSNGYANWWKYLLVGAISILAAIHCFTICNGCFLGSNTPYIQWIDAIRVWTVTDISVDMHIVNLLNTWSSKCGFRITAVWHPWWIGSIKQSAE